MKIYGFPLSPFVRKVLVSLKEKGLDAELVPSNPNQPDPEFSAVSPFHKIPAFRDGDFTIADSTAIVTYLDAKYPEPALLPASPEARARAIWFEEVADTVLIPTAAPIVVNRFLRPRIFGTEGDEAAALAAEEAVKRPLDYLESAVTDEWLDAAFSIGPSCRPKRRMVSTMPRSSSTTAKRRSQRLRPRKRPCWSKRAV